MGQNSSDPCQCFAIELIFNVHSIRSIFKSVIWAFGLKVAFEKNNQFLEKSNVKKVLKYEFYISPDILLTNWGKIFQG